MHTLISVHSPVLPQGESPVGLEGFQVLAKGDGALYSVRESMHDQLNLSFIHVPGHRTYEDLFTSGRLTQRMNVIDGALAGLDIDDFLS